MKLGLENRRQVIAVTILAPLAAGAVIYLAMQMFSSGTPRPATTAVAPRSAATTRTEETRASNQPRAMSARDAAKKNFAASGAQAETSPYDPTLHPEVMFAAEHLEYTGTGRNIFSAMSAPVVVDMPKPVASARIHQTQAAVQPSGPPPPPPIPLTLFGVETHSDGAREAFLKHGDDVFVAGAGEIVMRQYKVTKVTANSVEVTDLPYNHTQVLTMQTQP